MAFLKKDNQLIASVPYDNLEHWLEENGYDADYFDIQLEVDEQRKIIRHKISTNAGDNASLLGTTADGVQLLLFAFSQMTVALNKANSLAEVREAAAPFNDLATAFLSKVESEEVKLPFQAKGLESVVADIENRATAVAEVLGAN